MEFIDLLTVSRGTPENASLLELCSEYSQDLEDITVSLRQSDYESVYRYIELNMDHTDNCKRNFDRNPQVIMKMLLSLLNYRGYTEYLVSRLGSIDGIIDYADGEMTADGYLDDVDDTVSEEMYSFSEGYSRDGTEPVGAEATVEVEEPVEIEEPVEAVEEPAPDLAQGRCNAESMPEKVPDKESTQGCHHAKEEADETYNRIVEEDRLCRLEAMVAEILELVKHPADSEEECHGVTGLEDVSADDVKNALLSVIGSGALEDVMYTGEELVADILKIIKWGDENE